MVRTGGAAILVGGVRYSQQPNSTSNQPAVIAQQTEQAPPGEVAGRLATGRRISTEMVAKGEPAGQSWLTTTNQAGGNNVGGVAWEQWEWGKVWGCCGRYGQRPGTSQRECKPEAPATEKRRTQVR